MSGITSRSGFVFIGALVVAVIMGFSCAKEKAADEHKPGMETREMVAQRWTCPMHPEVISDEPGQCPECNMNLVPVEEEDAAHPGAEAREQWTCPMHPEVISDEPGQCPECNMNLVPMEERDGSSGHKHADPPPGNPEPESAQEWTCGMHPGIRSEEPGKCPICNMDLVPVKDDDTGALRIPPETLQLVGAEHDDVRYLPLVKSIWAVGKVDYDERRVKDVASRVPGRVENLYADFVGTEVSRGEPLLTIYSPELVTALAEFKTSLEAARQVTSQADAVAAGTMESLAQSARLRLMLWGLDGQEIQEALESDPAASYQLPIRSPISGTVIERNVSEGKYVKEGQNLFVVADLSGVWLTAEIYEDDIGHIQAGDMVMAHARAYPDEMFHGEIVFIDPYIDEKTRSARIRIDMENPGANLKPGMYLEAQIEVPVTRDKAAYWACPMHPNVIAAGPDECPECGMFLERIAPGHVLAVAKDAVVRIGDAPVVYVERGPGTYELRQVVVGDLAGVEGGTAREYYQVLEGLTAGERVITDASFLVHSQARLTGKAASAYGGALQVETSGHRH